MGREPTQYERRWYVTREVRGQENEKFEKFFSYVRNEADKRNCVFFVDCGEGRELFTDELDGEDLSGWLIPKVEADTFEKEFKTNDVSEKWNDFVCFAIWEQIGEKVEIEFKFY